MYYLVGNIENDLISVRKSLNSSLGHTEHEFASLYQLKTPFRLMIKTLHPDDENSFHTLTIIDPANVIYVTSGKSELQSNLPTTLHQHDFYEFLFILEGELYQNIENERHRYPAGSCCLLNKNVRHCEEYITDYRVVYLQISEELMSYIHFLFSVSYFSDDNPRLSPQLEEFFYKNLDEKSIRPKDYIDFIPLQDYGWQIRHVHQAIETIIHEAISPKTGSTFIIHEQLFFLFITLSDGSAYTTTPVSIGTDAGNKVFDQISQLLEAYHGRLSRKDIVNKLNYSGTYLNYITKKYAGLSLLDYGMIFCMKHAAHLLLETDMTVTEIALELGFTSRTQFYKKFQERYQITPAQYRKEKKRI